MKRIICSGMLILLSIIAFGQIQTQNMMKEILCTPPQFKGIENVFPLSEQGQKSQTLDEYMKNNVVYPIIDVTDGVQGTEVVKFIITPTGDLTDISIVNSVSKQIDNEVIKALKHTKGMWRPGYNDDKPEAMEKEVSVAFKISELAYLDFYKCAKKHFKKGNILLLVKDNPKKALKCFDKGIVLLPNDKALLVQRGIARYQVGNKDGALRDWNRVKALGGIESSVYLENFSNLKGYADLVRTLEN